MLYDPKWEVETKPAKANPFDLKQFVGWLEAQPADKAYEWCGHCLIEQYMVHLGFRPYHCYTAENDAGHSIYFCLTQGGIAYLEPHTFGAALTRARAML